LLITLICLVYYSNMILTEKRVPEVNEMDCRSNDTKSRIRNVLGGINIDIGINDRFLANFKIDIELGTT
jgi:hypothetical protein